MRSGSIVLRVRNARRLSVATASSFKRIADCVEPNRALRSLINQARVTRGGGGRDLSGTIVECGARPFRRAVAGDDDAYAVRIDVAGGQFSGRSSAELGRH